MAIEFDMSTLLPLMIIIGLIILVAILVRKLMGSKPKVQPITKDQYQRIVANIHVSAKLSRLKNAKWLNTTGDSVHPARKHYLRYSGSVPHLFHVVFVGRAHWYTPKRIWPVPWDLVHNLDGKEIWIECNGAYKSGYFMRVLITREHCHDATTVKNYDRDFNEFLKVLLGVQSLEDTYEQASYEIQSAMAHRERPMEDLMLTQEYPEYKESERDMPSEPGG